MGADFPLWTPPPNAHARSAIGRYFAAYGDKGGRPAPDADYVVWHEWSCRHPARFWDDMVRVGGVRLEADPVRSDSSPAASSRPEAHDEEESPVLRRGDRMAPPGPEGPAWFPGARLNFAEHLLDPRGEDGRPLTAPHEVAIIARGEGGARRELTRAQLARTAGTCAAALAREGVVPGDVVAGFLPNIPETIVGMLGSAWIGATWTSCSPDFGVKGVLDRFGQVAPRVLICADGYRYAGKDIDGLPRVREIVAAIPSIQRVVIVPFLRDALGDEALAGIRGAVRWDAWVAGAEGHGAAPAASRGAALPRNAPPQARLPFDHPLYIMYSSGTTGLPKCMVHGAGGTLLQHLKEHRLHCDIAPGERVFYFTTCGWMMWNWLASALGSGAAIVLYDGAPMPPGDPDALWHMAAEERIAVLGTSATFIAACEKQALAPARQHDLAALRMILSTGSPLAHHSFDYVLRDVRPGVHLASISGGTDLISCFVLGNPLLPVWRGEIQCAGLGMAVDVFDADGGPLRGAPGELVCTAPFPSMPIRFWNDADGSKYRDAYFGHFPGAWRHGDWVERTKHPGHDGFIVHGRSDATLNPGGVRIGTAEVYRQVEQVEGVVESVAIGQEVPDGAGGTDTRMVLFVRLAAGCTLDDPLRERIRRRLREHASPHHVPRIILQVRDIPRTISGKITELAVRDAVHGRPVNNTDALANPEALEEFKDRAELRWSAVSRDNDE